MPEKQKLESIGPKDLSLLVPCFNEVAVVGSVLRDLRSRFPEAEVIAVDDGSTDDTRTVLSSVPGVRVLVHSRNRGYGASIKTATAAATRKYVLWYDADGQHRPEMVSAILEVLGSGCDSAIGARTGASHATWLRQPGKWLLLWTARLLSGAPIVDLNSGLRAFRRSVLNRYLHLLPNGFSASTTTTILMLERGYNVRWVPITTAARVGTSTVKMGRDGARVMMLILRLVNMFSPLRFYLPVSGALLLIGLIYGLVRAIVDGRGVPVAALVIIVFGIQAFFFGMLADQISALRKERYENNPDISLITQATEETVAPRAIRENGAQR